MGYWDEARHHEDPELFKRFWLAHPRVRERVNERVSGDSDCWTVDWLVDRISGESPRERALSIGCGLGALELQLVEKGAFSEVEGVDVASGPIEEARIRAQGSPCANRVHYRCASAESALSAATGLDAVIFHGSLHHVEAIDATLDAVVAALRPGGLLLLDEYVGRAMREWTWPRLLLLTLVLWTVPRRVRRTRVVRAPRNPEDPTEKVAASRILPAVRARFGILELRPYGGQIVAPLFPSLRQPGDGPEAPLPQELDREVERLLGIEDALLARPWLPGSRSHHAVVVARTPPSSRVTAR